MAEISKTHWHNFIAWKLENEVIRIVVVPDLGAKIVSLFDKVHSYEWLVPPMRPLKQTSYGADFVSQDMSGWDEMLPTIVACDWEGAHLPDHGEVWSIPWSLESAADALVLSVMGVAMSYRFSRSAALLEPNCLELHYSLTNTGKTACPYLWTAHPQFTADPQTRIILPPEVTQMVNVIESDPNWGKSGDTHLWPEAIAANGDTQRLDRVAPVETHSCRKFYVMPEQPARWVGLANERLGCQLFMEWMPDEIPYLGLWVDEGKYNAVPVAAPEPSNGYYDSLERAVSNHKVMILEPGETRDWMLVLRFGISA